MPFNFAQLLQKSRQYQLENLEQQSDDYIKTTAQKTLNELQRDSKNNNMNKSYTIYGGVNTTPNNVYLAEFMDNNCDNIRDKLSAEMTKLGLEDFKIEKLNGWKCWLEVHPDE